MSTKLIHPVVIERRVFDDDIEARSEYGQPSMTTTTVATRGLVQPRASNEADDDRSAGSNATRHVVFLGINETVENASAIIWDGRRYEVTGMRPHRYGRLAHWEVDAMLNTEQPVTDYEAGS